MQIRRFEGPSVESVLAQVQWEVGPQAVILSTESNQSGGVVVLTGAEGSDHAAPPAREGVLSPFTSALAVERHLNKQGLLRKLSQHVGARFPEGMGAVRTSLERLVRALPDRQGAWKCAFVGPAESGKTTSLAKMAARRVAEGRSVELWTLDTYRVGAIEQMEKYAEILGAKFRALSGRDDVKRATREYDRSSDVFIDTGGVSPYDDRRLRELQRTLGGSSDVEVLLVQGAATAPAELVSCVRRYAPLNISGTILTKLDETARAGVVINLPFVTGVPLRFLGTGPEVPREGFRATSRLIAQTLLSSNPSQVFAEMSDE